MSQDIILVVDDIEVNRVILRELFKNRYEIIEAEDGREALEAVEKYSDSIVTILLDIIMPKMDGFEVLEALCQKDLLFHIPVILITGDASVASEKKGYLYGVADIIVKPFNSDIVRRRVQNIIDLYNYKKKLENMVTSQTKVLKEQAEQLKETNARIIDTMSTIVEFRNLESGEHIKRIKVLTNILAKCVADIHKEYELDAEKIDIITEASAMHDIGKIVIPDHILLKPAKLTTDEFEVMKTHTTKGCEIISSISKQQDERYLQYSYEICRYHHERYDGLGYPDGLKGQDIPIAAQIVSIADVYDALVSKRVYKKAFSKKNAYDMIQEGKCGIFSPEMLICFEKARAQYEGLPDNEQAYEG